METTDLNRPFNRRAFVSIALLASGLVLPLSGIMNHQLQFESLTQTRHFWMSVHNMSAFLFACFVVAHATLNWRTIVHYAKKAKSKLISKEAFVAIVLVAGVVGLFASHAFHAG